MYELRKLAKHLGLSSNGLADRISKGIPLDAPKRGDGNKTRLYKQLGITRSAMYRRRKKYGNQSWLETIPNAHNRSLISLRDIYNAS